jgi:hypothetical protein
VSCWNLRCGRRWTKFISACAGCEAGYYCNSIGTVAITRTLCPAGAYCPEGSKSPILCPSGTFSQATGQTSISTCERCLLGTYCLNEGTVTGQSCEAGHYCPTGSADYLDFCPTGTYGGSQGLTTADQCTICPIGSYCPSGSSSPFLCPPGTYESNIRSGFSCQSCAMHVLTLGCHR